MGRKGGAVWLAGREAGARPGRDKRVPPVLLESAAARPGLVPSAKRVFVGRAESGVFVAQTVNNIMRENPL